MATGYKFSNQIEMLVDPGITFPNGEFPGARIGIDDSQFDGVIGWYFEVVARSNGANTATITLHNNAGSDVISVTVPTGAYARVRSAQFSLSSGSLQEYTIVITNGAASTLDIAYARLIVKHDTTTTSTLLYFPI
jgi:hypothetical protein